MAQITMYGAINNSPKTVVSVSMTASDTTIQVENVDALPAPPNLATLGEDENAEVISYSGKQSNTLTGVVRGIKGTTASPWPTGTMVYRAYTAYDHDAFKANIEDLENRKVASVNNVMPDDNKNILLSADDIEETASRVFVSPQEKAKWNSPGDIINGTLSVWQRYNAADSSTYTNPSNAYIADRFRAAGTGTVQPNARGYGADITGTITMQYWMEKTDFALLPDPVIVYYSVDGAMQSTSTAKASVQTDSDGNACIFSKTITNQTLDWVSLYPGQPVRPYAEEMALCQRYYQTHALTLPPIKENTNAAIYAIPKVNLLMPMRVAPTATYVDQFGNSGLTYYITQSNRQNISPSSFTIITDRVVKIVFTMPNGVTMALGDFVYTNLTLDAEIY